jgi:hypothetical protein
MAGPLSDAIGVITAVKGAYSAAAGPRGQKAMGIDPLRSKAADHPDSGRFFSRAMDSVARKAKQSILLFPVVVTDNVRPETAGLVAKMVQVRSAEYVRLAITNMDKVVSDGSVGEKSTLIGQLRGASLRDPLWEGARQMLRKDALSLAAATSRPDPELAGPIERFLVSESDTSAPGDDEPKKRRPWDVHTAADDAAGVPPPSNDGPSDETPEESLGPDDLDRRRREWRERESQKGTGTPEEEDHQNKLADRAAKAAKEERDERAKGNTAGWSKTGSLEDVNRFLPVILDLSFKYQTLGPDGKALESQAETAKLALGVKSVVHVVPASDMVAGLGKSQQRDSLFLQFLRMTSGEISLVKDFLLNIDVARDRAAPATSQGRRMLEGLRRQAEWNRTRGNQLLANLTKRGFVPPTTTIVITSEDAQQIRAKFNVDFTRASVVRQLLSSHNLTGFVIVDEALGLARVFEDGDDDFDRVPFSEMERKGKQMEVKDVMTLLNRR